jgi:hypothetical protein
VLQIYEFAIRSYFSESDQLFDLKIRKIVIQKVRLILKIVRGL